MERRSYPWNQRRHEPGAHPGAMPHRPALGHGLSAEHHRLEFLERGASIVERRLRPQSDLDAPAAHRKLHRPGDRPHRRHPLHRSFAGHLRAQALARRLLDRQPAAVGARRDRAS